MEAILFISSLIGDILLVSLFLWHSLVRTKRLTREIHAINERTRNCPYKRELKRIK